MTKKQPDNLGKRQYDLNTKVNNAAANNVNFNEIIDEADDTELTKFFNIDLAAKCKNVDYIVEVLKAGETLYAHRALKKCKWLFDDEHSAIMNPEYLHDTIFPVTSMKVKKLILNSVAMGVRTEDRAASFYEYCMKINMAEVAFKCLLFTNEEFKLNLMENHNQPPFNKIVHQKFSYIKFIIGKSFTLLEAYMKMLKGDQDNTIRKFQYLYPVDNIAYLQLLEQYVEIRDWSPHKFDTQFCVDIMKKHKERVLSKPLFYLKTFGTDTIFRYSTKDDAKIYAAALFPSSAHEFWRFDHHIYLAMVNHHDMYQFLRNLFNEKYPGEEFETTLEFYGGGSGLCQFMTVEELEELALYHIKSDKQILGVGNDYIWYKFINFQDAFKAVKQFIIVTQEAKKRNDMLEVLAVSCRNDRELETLFNYYHRRHVNELRSHKESFLDKVIEYHYVFHFDESCWDAFYTLLLSMELYNTLDYKDGNEKYKIVTLIYYILHRKEISDELMVFLLEDFFPHQHLFRHHVQRFNDEDRLFVYNYLNELFIQKIYERKNMHYTRASLNTTRKYFEIVLNLMSIFNVNREEPKRVHHQKERKIRHVDMQLSDVQLLRELKKDKSLVTGRLIDLENLINQNNPLKISNFLKKIKIYFKSDVSESFLDMFKKQITKALDMQSVNACMHGIFELGDQSIKLQFMNDYAPENTKLDFNNVDPQHLRIQKAICQYAPMSLPPVPLSNMLIYLQGDYVQYCVHIFSKYISILPTPACTEFVKSLLDTPVSVQKHALRLAFQCFDTPQLKDICINIWEKSKNVSLRTIIYKGLFNRVAAKDESELYDVLISFTLDLNDDDGDEIFDIVLLDTLSHDIHGRYKEATWKAISKFKDREPNIQRKTKVINAIQSYSHLMEKYFFGTIIKEHLFSMFVENKLELYYSNEDIAELYKAKWYLTADYIFSQTVDFARDGRDHQKYLDLAQTIVKNCVEKWDKKYSEKFIYQQCCWDFIRDLNVISLHYYNNSAYLIPIFKGILEVVKTMLPLHENYTLRWQLQVTIYNRQVTKKYWETIEKDNFIEVLCKSTRELGTELGKELSTFVENNEYFISLTENVKDIIHKSVKELLDNFLTRVPEEKDEHFNSALLSLILGMMEIEMAETYLLAIKLLPTQCKDSSSHEYNLIIEKINKMPNPEVQHAAYQQHQQYLKKT